MDLKKIVKIGLDTMWKLGVFAIGVAGVFLIVFIAKEIKRENMRGGKQVSAYLKEYTEDGYAKLYNERERKFTLEHLDWVSYGVGDDRIGVYSKNLKRGFYDYDSGYPISEPKYNKAWNFSEGLGAVETDGMLGFVNRDMDLVIPQRYRIARSSDDWPDAIQFHKGQCVINLSPDSVGVIDKHGNWVIPPVYQYVSELSTDSCRVIKKGGLAGILDYQGNTVIEPEYDAVRISNAGIAVVAKDGLQYQRTYAGTKLTHFTFDDVMEFNEPHPFYELYEVNDRWGVLDKRTMKAIIPAIYDGVELLSDDRFKAKLHQTENITSEPQTRTDSYIILDKNNRVCREIGN